MKLLQRMRLERSYKSTYARIKGGVEVTIISCSCPPSLNPNGVIKMQSGYHGASWYGGECGGAGPPAGVRALTVSQQPTSQDHVSQCMLRHLRAEMISHIASCFFLSALTKYHHPLLGPLEKDGHLTRARPRVCV